MMEYSKVCRTVEEFISTLMALQLYDYTTQFNLDGTWTIRYKLKMAN